MRDPQYEFWEKKKITWEDSGKVFLRAIEYLKKPSSILDIGCGNGLLEELLETRGYYDNVGIDYSVSLIKEAKTKSNSKFFVKDCCKPLKFLKRTFDVVMLCDVLEHVYSPYYLIRNAADVTKVGGTIVVSTPNALRSEIDGYMKEWKNAPMRTASYHYLTPHVIKRIFISAGCKQTYVDWKCKIGIGNIFAVYEKVK